VTAAPFPRARSAWFSVGVLFAAAILSYTDRQIINLLVDPIRADLGIGDVQASLLQGAAFAVVYALAGLPMGRWADSHSRRNLIAVGVVTWSLATAACGLAQSFEQLFIARMMVGIGEAALAPAALSLIADLFPPNRRGTAIGVFLSGMAAGAAAAITFGGLLLAAFQGGALSFLPLVGEMEPWRAVLVSLGVPGILVAGLVLLMREPPRRDKAAGLGAEGEKAGLRPLFRFFQAHRATFVLLFGALAVSTIADYGLMAWTPSYLMRQWSFSPAEVGAWMGGIAMATGAVGTLFGGMATDWMGRTGRPDAKIRLAFAALLVGLPAQFFAIALSAPMAVALFGLYTLASAVASTAAITALQDVVPSTMRGTATSLIAFLNTLLGLGLGPTLVAVMTEQVYADPAAVGLSIFTVAFPISLVVLVMFWLLHRPYARTRAAVVPG